MSGLFSGLHFSFEEASVLMATVFLCLFAINSKRSLLNRRARKDMLQTQRSHSTATPRLGGAVIFAAVVLTAFFVDGFFGERYAKFALAMLPMIGVTLWEDMIRPTSPQIRLSATLASCFLTVMTLQVWLPSLDISLIDPWMTGGAGAIITVLFVASTVNGFNLVDGLNGLCAGIALAVFISFHLIANAVGHGFMSHITLNLAVATAGFLIFNFPRAKLFLGDTGAYVIGFVISWFGVSLCYRFPEVSPWAIFLVLAYPLSELVLSFARRLLSGRSPFQPDTSHIHHLVLLLLRQRLSYGKSFDWHNPTATLVILPLAIAPMIPAIWFFDRPGILQALTLSYGLMIASLYAGLYVLTRQQQEVSRHGTLPHSQVAAEAEELAGEASKRHAA